MDCGVSMASLLVGNSTLLSPLVCLRFGTLVVAGLFFFFLFFFVFVLLFFFVFLFCFLTRFATMSSSRFPHLSLTVSQRYASVKD